MKRRDFILTTSIAGLGFSVMPAASCTNNSVDSKSKKGEVGNSFVQAPLGYEYAALEPYIDSKTMEIHYSKHHAGYVRKLNAAIEKHPLKDTDLENIMQKVTASSADTAIVNAGGGHYNHSLFWEIMTPGGSNKITGNLAKAIQDNFGSQDVFLEQFSQAAATVFGSGWAWLSVNDDKQLFVSATQNQENPAMGKIVTQPGTPILGLDVWEHAYYLKYQNKRKEYISNFIKTINWDIVSKKLDMAM